MAALRFVPVTWNARNPAHHGARRGADRLAAARGVSVHPLTPQIDHDITAQARHRLPIAARGTD